jgi:uncharacterized protein (DUF1684 family)
MNVSEPEIIYHLGYALVELNRNSEARAMFDKLKGYPVDNPFRVKANRLVQSKGI